MKLIDLVCIWPPHIHTSSSGQSLQKQVLLKQNVPKHLRIRGVRIPADLCLHKYVYRGVRLSSDNLPQLRALRDQVLLVSSVYCVCMQYKYANCTTSLSLELCRAANFLGCKLSCLLIFVHLRKSVDKSCNVISQPMLCSLPTRALQPVPVQHK